MAWCTYQRIFLKKICLSDWLEKDMCLFFMRATNFTWIFATGMEFYWLQQVLSKSQQLCVGGASRRSAKSLEIQETSTPFQPLYGERANCIGVTVCSNCQSRDPTHCSQRESLKLIYSNSLTSAVVNCFTAIRRAYQASVDKLNRADLLNTCRLPSMGYLRAETSVKR